jgi:hypothetical protein
MRKRLLLAILPALLLLAPAAYYGYFGLLRKEHFYRGLPSTYWANRIRDWGGFVTDRPPIFPAFVWEHCGFRDNTPRVLRGNFKAIPVLVDLLFQDDDNIHPFVFLGLGWTPRLMASLEQPVVEQKVSSSRFGNSVVLIIGGVYADRAPSKWSHPPPVAQNLVLMDREGRVLDALSCSLSPALGNEYIETGCLTVDAQATGSSDGVELVVNHFGNLRTGLRHEVKHAGRKCEYDWSEDAIPARQWLLKGLCRVAVRNGRFEVLWPPLRAGKEPSL